MSASLVGSEMCIRDSVNTSETSNANANATDSGMTAQKGTVLSCHCLWPVSYTHLTLPTICSV
eukprot:6008946-Alexandrium_andersonii.AAC.1